MKFIIIGFVIVGAVLLFSAVFFVCKKFFVFKHSDSLASDEEGYSEKVKKQCNAVSFTFFIFLFINLHLFTK